MMVRSTRWVRSDLSGSSFIGSPFHGAPTRVYLSQHPSFLLFLFGPNKTGLVAMLAAAAAYSGSAKRVIRRATEARTSVDAGASGDGHEASGLTLRRIRGHP
jgi:hypothetical protein